MDDRFEFLAFQPHDYPSHLPSLPVSDTKATPFDCRRFWDRLKQAIPTDLPNLHMFTYKYFRDH